MDDVKLPGMLHGAILRSPHAHARIVSIDTTRRRGAPEGQGRHHRRDAGRARTWPGCRPSRYDTQAVLATDKVRFQGQEVAFVVAEDHYAARDALELIDVEYEPLPPVIDARARSTRTPPVIRDDKEGTTDNHIFDWEAGDRAATDEVFARADVVVAQDMLYPRSHPAPLETCGAVADMDRVTGKLTVWTTTQAPHAHRTVYALVAGLPEHKIRVISPDIGGGFGNKVRHLPRLRLRGRRLDRHRQAGEVDGGPLREPDEHRRSPATTTCAARSPPPATARSSGCGSRCSPTTAPSTAPRSRPSSRPGSSTSSPARTTCRPRTAQVTGVYTNKAPGGVAYACSFRITEAVYLVERMVDVLARELGVDPAELRMANLLRPEQFPYTCPTGWEYDSGDYPQALHLAMDMAGYDKLRAGAGETGVSAAS